MMPRPATTTSLPLPLQFLAAWIATWLGEHQARMIEYQRAENAALLERLGKHRLRLTDGERRRLAKLGKALGRKALQQGGHHRHTGHDPPLVSRARGGEVRWQQEARTGAAEEGCRDRATATGDGHAEYGVGLHEGERRCNGFWVNMASSRRLSGSDSIRGRRSSKRTWVRSRGWTSSRWRS